jgi:hypothetical protein
VSLGIHLLVLRVDHLPVAIPLLCRATLSCSGAGWSFTGWILSKGVTALGVGKKWKLAEVQCDAGALLAGPNQFRMVAATGDGSSSLSSRNPDLCRT